MTISSSTTTSSKLIMGKLAPQLEVRTLNGALWNLAEQRPGNYTMVVFYRGQHCPICVEHITGLDQKRQAFLDLGIDIIAISGDGFEKATAFQQQANLQNLTLGYGLTPEDMSRWGLYLSRGHFESEPTLFSEPALFLVKPDGLLYLSNIGTHPFSRVDLDLLLKGIQYVIANDYPFRGTE